MRARMIRPEFLADELMGTLPDSLVLFYVKLWVLTDDAGYFEWRPIQIAAAVYPYRAPRRRLTDTNRWLSELMALDRIERLGCERHAIVRSIPRYRMYGGHQSFHIKARHETVVCKSPPIRIDTDRSFSGTGTGTGTGTLIADARDVLSARDEEDRLEMDRKHQGRR